MKKEFVMSGGRLRMPGKIRKRIKNQKKLADW